MKAHELLQQSAYTLNQRGEQNGYDKAEERSAAAIASLFNAKTGRDLTEAEAWQFLICLKEVRLMRQVVNGSDTSDTLIDLISYQALLAECLSPQ